MQCGELVNAHEEHRFELQAFDVLDVEHAHVAFLAHRLTLLGLGQEAFARSLSAAKVELIAVAVHPGYSDTNLQTEAARMSGSAITGRIMAASSRMMAQSPEMGALPSLYALTAEDVQGGDFIGPGGLMQMWGYPARVEPAAMAKDPELAARLWAVSQQLTGVRYDALAN